MQDVALVVLQFLELPHELRTLLDRTGLHALRRRRIRRRAICGIHPRLNLGDVAAKVAEDLSNRSGMVAVKVDERRECPFRTGEEPVDRTLLVALKMIGVEVLHEIAPKVLA